MKNDEGIKIITKNKKAYFEYIIEEKFEAGISLTGSEVKSLRDGKGNLADSYVLIKGGEAFLLHAHIAQYPPAANLNHEPRRARRLLLHAREIKKLDSKLTQKGLTIIPTMMYFKAGRAKVELAIAKGKKKYDKREAMKRRETARNIERAFRR
jgi:SsrA-binding protein